MASKRKGIAAKKANLQQSMLQDISIEQKKVRDLRKRINRRDLEAEKINYYTPYKNWTYAWIFLFPPYGWYRLWNKNTEFRRQEQLLLMMVSVVYVIALYLHLSTGMAFW